MSSTPLDLLTVGLLAVLREHGLERACADANWLQNILADFSPQTQSLNRVAALVAREGVPGWLNGAAPDAAHAVVTQAVNQLVSTHAIDQGAAHDAVSAWARALGVEYSGARPTSAPAAGVDERVARKIQKLLDDADDAENSGDYAEAVERYEEVLTLDPGHTSAVRLKAFAERRRDSTRPGSPPPRPASSQTPAKEKGGGRAPIVVRGVPSTPSGTAANNPRNRTATPPQLPNTLAQRELENKIRQVRKVCSTFQDARVGTPWTNMEFAKLTKALASYGKGVSTRSVLLFYDDTLFGGAKEGFVITTKGVNWKNSFAPPEAIKFSDIKMVSSCDGWGAAKILVNDREISVCMNNKKGIAELASEIIRIMAGLQGNAADGDEFCIGE